MPAPTPIEVVARGTDEILGFACATCRNVWTALIWPASSEHGKEAQTRAAREAAANCCYKLCKRCDSGEPTCPGWTMCESCAAQHEVDKEAARFEKAEKIAESDYEGWICWEEHGPQNGYFSSLEEMREYAEEHSLTLPGYVYACEESRVPGNIDAYDLLDNELQDAYEGAVDDMDTDGLQDLLNEWLSQNRRPCYSQDLHRVVILNLKPE